MSGRTEAHAGNIGLAIWRLTCFYETFVQGSTAVILLKVCAENPPHRQDVNRYAQCYDDRQDSNQKVIGGLSTSRLRLDIEINFQGQFFV